MALVLEQGTIKIVYVLKSLMTAGTVLNQEHKERNREGRIGKRTIQLKTLVHQRETNNLKK